MNHVLIAFQILTTFSVETNTEKRKLWEFDIINTIQPITDEHVADHPITDEQLFIFITRTSFVRVNKNK